MSSVLFHFTEKAGPYSVGLKVVEQYDYSRTYRGITDELGKRYQGERARPLQTLVWYPSEQGTAESMTVNDYLDLWTTERNFGKPKVPSRAKEWRAGMAPTLAKPLWAVRDAPPALGRFPVVIYSPGHSSPSWENADLCEYLSSYGYVVIASPSMGASTCYPTLDLAGIEPQARDISFLVGYAQTLPNTDMSRIAAAGFSWGGICNLFAAARDNRIRALVTLDGGQRFHPGLVRQAGDVIPEQMTIPLLSIAQGQWLPEDKALFLDSEPGHDGADVLNAWRHGDLITVHLLGFTHGEHSSMSQRNEGIWRLIFQLYPAKKVDYGREDSITGYAWLARYTLQFLNAYLKHDAVALAFLKKTPVENGAPRRFMTVKFRPATGIPASFEEFRRELGRQGFDRAADIYAKFRRTRSDFKLEEYTISAWAEELIDGDHFREAIALLELSVQLNPSSGTACMSLGDAYQKWGRKRFAIESYKHALEKGPPWAVMQAANELRELEGGATAGYEKMT
jgi:hypothetical protein